MIRPKAATSLAATAAAAFGVSACANPHLQPSLKDSSILSAPMKRKVMETYHPPIHQPVWTNKPLPVIPTKSVKPVPVPEDLLRTWYYNGKCYFLNRDCLQCEAYLTDEKRAKIPDAVRHHEESGPDGLVNQLSQRLTTWKSSPPPRFGQRLPKHMEELRQDMIFESIVLGLVMKHDGRFDRLIDAVSKAIRCAN